MSDRVVDLLEFIDRSPTPYHAVAEATRRLEACGFRVAREDEVWDFAPGERRYVVRQEGSLVAFQIGSISPVDGGFRVIGAHTDSPNLRVKPVADVSSHGYRQLAVEPYGGVLLHTWLDRDLSLAGRVTARDPDAGGTTRTWLLDFARPILRIPTLALHLQRELRTDGLLLNAQKHMAPLIGLDSGPAFSELLASELRAQHGCELQAEDVFAFDLMTYDLQPSVVSGVRGEFVHAPRLDNLASCHAALAALTDTGGSPPPTHTSVVAFYDHEEVGSRSAQGAAGPLLESVLERSVSAFKGGEVQGLARALSRSALISADMAHAVHPNFADRHEPGHLPVIGQGPVIKSNANQSYATDAHTAGLFRSLCAQLDVQPQHFVTRSDLGCGSTIGPITAARIGIPTVDVGNPMLSMHSCREMCGSADVAPMIDVLRLFFAGENG